MPRLDVTIKTRDGICPASVFTPSEGVGPWPAVIFFMDGYHAAAEKRSDVSPCDAHI